MNAECTQITITKTGMQVIFLGAIDGAKVAITFQTTLTSLDFEVGKFYRLFPEHFDCGD